MNTLCHPRLENALTCLGETIINALGDKPELLADVDNRLSELRDELGLVLSEHSGMAGELLRTYEQLGIIFEVTSKLSTVSTEDQVIQLFVDSLRVTYNENTVYSVERHDDGNLKWTSTPSVGVDTISAVIRDSIDNRRVVVQTLDRQEEDIAEIMSAPVFSGNDFVCAIVLTHDNSAAPFEASDMNLLEAMVLFCSDLLRNYHLADQLRSLSINMVKSLVNAIDQKDNYTSGHSNRVGDYAKLLGVEFGMDDEELQMLEWAALLHDVGKIGIRDDVLKKPGKLTNEEYEHIKEHPVRSYEIMSGVPQLRKALEGARHHHERYDGNGYPDGLKGEEISLHARIIQVADIFDALTTTRSYRAAYSWEKALSILHEEAGEVTDPNIVDLFDRIIRREAGLGTLQCESPSNCDKAAMANARE